MQVQVQVQVQAEPHVGSVAASLAAAAGGVV